MEDSKILESKVMLALEIQKHKKNLDRIKKIVKASNVCYFQRGDQYSVRVIKDGKDTFFSLDGTPWDVDQERYDEFLKTVVQYYA